MLYHTVYIINPFVNHVASAIKQHTMELKRSRSPSKFYIKIVTMVVSQIN